MAKIIMIAAVGKNLELGKNNNLIWHLKEDLTFFKNTTMNHKIVMGYNTFQSLPKLLPGRTHLVITHRDLNINKVSVYHNETDLFNYLKSLKEDVYIIGGATIYKLMLDKADELLLTEIDAEDKYADAYFPAFNKEEYEREVISELEEQNIKFKHVRYRRR